MCHFILSFRSLQYTLCTAQCTLPFSTLFQCASSFGWRRSNAKISFALTFCATFARARDYISYTYFVISFKSYKITLLHGNRFTSRRRWLNKKKKTEIPPINVAQILFYNVVIFNDYLATAKTIKTSHCRKQYNGRKCTARAQFLPFFVKLNGIHVRNFVSTIFAPYSLISSHFW